MTTVGHNGEGMMKKDGSPPTTCGDDGAEEDDEG